MAKILKPGVSWVGYEVTCGFCTCRFQIEQGDLRLTWDQRPSVICPGCRAAIPLAVPKALKVPESEQARLEAAWRHQTQGQRPDPRLSGEGRVAGEDAVSPELQKLIEETAAEQESGLRWLAKHAPE